MYKSRGTYQVFGRFGLVGTATTLAAAKRLAADDNRSVARLRWKSPTEWDGVRVIEYHSDGDYSIRMTLDEDR